MRLFLTIIIALSLSACATQQEQVNAVATQAGFISFATLSSSDDAVESSASVVYVKLAQYRYNAASLLRARKISLSAAEYSLSRSDEIRNYLDKAVKKRSLLAIRSAEKQIYIAANKLELGL